jgi:hypothetical protein
MIVFESRWAKSRPIFFARLGRQQFNKLIVGDIPLFTLGLVGSFKDSQTEVVRSVNRRIHDDLLNGRPQTLGFSANSV